MRLEYVVGQIDAILGATECNLNLTFIARLDTIFCIN